MRPTTSSRVERTVDVCGEIVGLGTDGRSRRLTTCRPTAPCSRNQWRNDAAGIAAPGEQADIAPFAVDLRTEPVREWPTGLRRAV
jgi:hypothetical protein